LSLKQSTALNHLDGACTTFFQLFEHLNGQFSAMHILETDTRPMQKEWLKSLVDVASLPNVCSNWWVKGSSSLCQTNYASPKPIDAKIDFHINGNALYALSCNEFNQFLIRLQLFYPALLHHSSGGCDPNIVNEGGYDHAMFRYLHSSENFAYTRWILGKFHYSKHILNFCEDLYDVKDLRKRSSEALLVHSKSAFLDDSSRAIFNVFYNALGRSVSFHEIEKQFKYLLPKLESGELTEETLNEMINPETVHDVLSKHFKKYLYGGIIEDSAYWASAFPGKTYVWSSDFHHGPIVCQMPIFKAANALVHAEIDFGNCIHSGFCKERLKVLSFDDWRGFSLRSNGMTPKELKKAFYQAYQNDPEIKRVDAFICSHPAANCQLYMQFGKPIIIHFTTRMEFGRDDGGIDWRLPTWTKNIGKIEWRDWVNDLITLSKSPKNLIIANNMYDVSYVKFFTGIDIQYVPSWCGDKNYIFDAVHNKLSPYQAAIRYAPYIDEFLVGPYRINLDMSRFKRNLNAKEHIIMKEFFASNSSSANNIKISFMSDTFSTGFLYKDLVKYKGLVIIPYQVSTIFLMEAYRMNIPMFCPSLALLCRWHNQSYDFMFERIYGWPKRLDEGDLNVPDPNSDNAESFAHWIKFSDFYVLPHIVQFDSFDDLFSKLGSSDLYSISDSMSRFNSNEKNRLIKFWSKHFETLKRVV